ncbi:MAG TPA: hypothetical protein VNP04_15470 [Alphaproteobacteria bacterium]|nr:hypothetical protein [Alphaproteobacteria bacterium]
MPSSRFFFQNFISDIAGQLSFVTSGGSPNAPATVLGPQAVKNGFAVMGVGGTYNSFIERTYRVEVHSTTDGTFAGSRIRWSDTGGVTWNQQNITPQNGVAIPLSFNVTLTFTDTGVAPQFVLGDAWIFTVILRYGPHRALDGSRDTEWRSGTVADGGFVAWQLDFGSPVLPKAVIADGLSTIPLRYQILGNLSGFTDPADFFLELNNVQTRLLQLITPAQPMRYWRFVITNTFGIQLDYVHIAELYIGGEVLMTDYFTDGFRRSQFPILSEDANQLMRGPGPVSFAADRLEVSYDFLPQATDIATLQSLWTYTQDTANGVKRPFWVMPRDDQVGDWNLYQWLGGFVRDHQVQDRFRAPIVFHEVVRTRPL